MNINGSMLVGSSEIRGTEGVLRAWNPTTGAEMEPDFAAGGRVEVNRACLLAQEAFDSYRETPLETRAQFLRAIGQGILALGDQLAERACGETGLPRGRIEGERGRTVGQLELFASVVCDGRWIGATLDSHLPNRKPLPRPDLRLRKIALGPVAVFGASNFPLAFSVAGGDTASAFAAGCPVVVKSHPSHLGTSELVARVIQKAVATCGLHEGVFSLLVGQGNAIGRDLVQHPAIKAVGFTGSRLGGLSLMRIAAERPEPIPVYAEMSSINPIFLFPSALAKNAETLARGFVDSVTLGVGHFCTNPGIVFGIESEDFAHFRRAAAQELSTRSAGTMLSPQIHSAYQRGLERLDKIPNVHALAQVDGPPEGCLGAPALFSTTAKQLLTQPECADEVFGPASILVGCETAEEMRTVLEQMPGQLTASLLLEEQDIDMARALLPLLERKVGRIVFNGFPTGVEVSHAMVHGGPFPATSDSRMTSVGASAIERFLRPISYQNMPQALMPASLQDANPLKLWRVRDGKLQQR
jgi:alpha-ketoglutaric semialdehyde dehydrogenase